MVPGTCSESGRQRTGVLQEGEVKRGIRVRKKGDVLLLREQTKGPRDFNNEEEPYKRGSKGRKSKVEFSVKERLQEELL